MNVHLKTRHHAGDSYMYPTLANTLCYHRKRQNLGCLHYSITGAEHLKSENHTVLSLVHAPTYFQTQEPTERRGTTVVSIDQLTTSEKYIKKEVEI